MMKRLSIYRNLAGLAAVLAASMMAFAQTPAPAAPQGPADLIIKISTAGGTYAKMGQQIQQVCPAPSIALSESAGTLVAMDDVLNNRANIMFLTTDALWARKTVEQDNSVDALRVLMPLYRAELHIVARRTDGNINKFSDLGNKKVGTYGSGYVTARVLFANTNVRPIALQDYKDEATLIAAIGKNEVDAGFIVVGQPASWASGLNGNQYKLVDFDRRDVLGKFGYTEATLRYPNLSSTTIKTLATPVSLVTYNYESKKKIQDLSLLKQCITENIGDLKETTGFHAKWREVDPKGKSDWQMFQTVNVGQPAATSTKKK